MSSVDRAIEEWRRFVGNREVRAEMLEVESLRRYALAVDSDPDVMKVMPPLGHWAFFLPGPRDDELSPEGHTKASGFLPPINLPGMFAGSAISFHSALLPGREAVLLSAVRSIEHKVGRSGDLVFVAVERVLMQDGTARITETQNYVYRGEAAPTALPEPRDEPIEGELWEPGEVHLFRFSAATFNGHRIHYDLRYARDVEGYPALIVHGPFIAAKLAALASRKGELAMFSFRAQAPVFLSQPVRLRHRADVVEAVRCDGAVSMIAQATYK